MRILIVESQIEVLEVLYQLLQKPFVEIDLADSIAQAALFLESRVYDFAVLSSRLPDGDSLGLVGRIRRESAETKVLFITGDAGNYSVRKRAYRSGAHAVLRKPLFAEALIGTVFGPVRGWGDQSATQQI